MGFFSVTAKLNQVEKQIFCYDNVLQVETLYGHFKPRHRIYLSYVIKLFLQLLLCAASFFTSAWIFTDFSHTFVCPDSTSDDVVDGWPLNTTVTCAYTIIQVLSMVRFIDFVLIGGATLLVLRGIIWCFTPHYNYKFGIPDELKKAKIDLCMYMCGSFHKLLIVDDLQFLTLWLYNNDYVTGDILLRNLKRIQDEKKGKWCR